MAVLVGNCCIPQEILTSMGIVAMGDIINILKHAKKIHSLVSVCVWLLVCVWLCLFMGEE